MTAHLLFLQCIVVLQRTLRRENSISGSRLIGNGFIKDARRREITVECSEEENRGTETMVRSDFVFDCLTAWH